MKKKSLQKRISIQTKLLICILIAALAPIIFIASVFAGKLYQMVIADTISEEQAHSQSVVPMITEQRSELDTYMETLESTDYYRMIFNERIDEDWDQLAGTDAAVNFQKQINQIIEDTPIQAVRIYLRDTDQSFLEQSTSKGIFASEAEIVSTYWHGIFSTFRSGNTKTLIDSELYCPKDYLLQKERNAYGDSAIIFSRTYNYQDTVSQAYIAFYLSSDVFAEIMQNGMTNSNAVSYIINDHDAVVASTDDKKYSLYISHYDEIEDAIMNSNSFLEKTVGKNASGKGVDVYTAMYNIPNEKWFLVTVIPKAPVYRAANIGMLEFAAVCVIIIVLAVIVCNKITRSITTRIAAVAGQMEKVHEGPPVAMPDPAVKDEIGELIGSYNYMTVEMNHLIEQQKKTSEELRLAEFNALQAQINPHFLYNTMDMINWMAVQGKNEEVSETVQNLARFYKLTLSRKKHYSTIQDELNHASVYIQLMNMRFNDGIDFVIDVPDELTEYRIPRLTFQPILENSILHGILEKEEKTGTIVLTAWSEDDDIVILISDDGVGMKREVLEQVLSEERTIQTRGTNIAIINIHKRLKILYGSRYGLSYSSTEGQGCDVTIRLPKHLGDTPYVRPED